MDLSVIAYCSLIPVAVLFIESLRPNSVTERFLPWYYRFVIILLTLSIAGNLVIYNYWGTVLNYRALSYLGDPGEVLLSLTWQQILSLFAGIVVCIGLEFFIFFNWIYRRAEAKIPGHKMINGGYFILIIFILVTLMRGGWQMLPMNESLVTFSRDQFMNQAAINPAWHLGYDVYTAGLVEKNPFVKLPGDKANEIVKELLTRKDSLAPRIFSGKDLNIVILILESFNSDLVEATGGEKNLTPEFNHLVNDGLLFSNLYSSGGRTDQGIVSVLNGWPATPYHSIMRSQEKSRRLPSLTHTCSEHHYKTSFYYGGESNFSNLDIYCLNEGFNRIVELQDFPANVPKGKWGVPDENVFEKMEHDLDNEPEPFFSVAMTLSNHEPFDVPGPRRFQGNDEAGNFKNAAAYADDCLGKFFSYAEKQSWYPRTIFILVADHGHILPMHRSDVRPESHRIPMLWFGNPLLPEFRGQKINILGGHHDLAATLLPQLNWNDSAFHWSKNLLAPDAKNFAYYQLEHMLGWLEDNDWVLYSYHRDEILNNSKAISTPVRDSLLIHGSAFIQELYKEYQSY